MKIWVSVFNEKGKKVEEKELREYRVTGWEDAPSHINLPRLKVIGGMQSPLDTATWLPGKYNPKYNYVFWCKDERVKTIERGSDSGNYIAVRGNETGTYVTFVHVNGHSHYKKGVIIEQGDAICKIAPLEENGGYPPHLHIDAVKGRTKTRDIVFYKKEETCEDKIKSLQEAWAKERINLVGTVDKRNKEIGILTNKLVEIGDKLVNAESQIKEMREAVIKGTIADYLNVSDLLRAAFARLGGTKL